MVNHLDDDVPAGRSCARGNVRGMVPDATIAMHWGGGVLPLHLGPLALDAGVMGGGCDAGAGLPFKGHYPRQKAADLATKSGDRCSEGLEISSGGGGHRIYSYGRGRHEDTTVGNGSGSR